MKFSKELTTNSDKPTIAYDASVQYYCTKPYTIELKPYYTRINKQITH